MTVGGRTNGTQGAGEREREEGQDPLNKCGGASTAAPQGRGFGGLEGEMGDAGPRWRPGPRIERPGPVPRGHTCPRALRLVAVRDASPPSACAKLAVYGASGSTTLAVSPTA